MNKLKQRIKDRLGEKRTVSLKKALKIARVVKNVICWLMIAVLTLAIIVFMITKLNGGSPTLFGYSINRIGSGSMVPELEIGDVIIGKQVTDTSDVSVGDIITFQGDSRFDNQKVTHRILVEPYSNGNGNTVVVTKGDANELDDGEILFSDIKSKCIAKVAFLKDIYTFFFSQWGLITFIVLLLLIFFDEIMNIIRLSIHSGEENEESFEEIVERIKREQLEKANQNAVEASTSDEKAGDKKEEIIAQDGQRKEDLTKADSTRADELSKTKNADKLRSKDKPNQKAKNKAKASSAKKGGKSKKKPFNKKGEGKQAKKQQSKNSKKKSKKKKKKR